MINCEPHMRNTASYFRDCKAQKNAPIEIEAFFIYD